MGMLEFWNNGVLGQMRPKTFQGFCSPIIVFPIIPIFHYSNIPSLPTDSYILTSETMLYACPFLRKRIARHSSMVQLSTASK
jgi:hypothetical protein